MYNHNVLSELYKLLHKHAAKNPDKCPPYSELAKILPSHTLVYVRAAIEQATGQRLTYKRINELLREEGLLQAKEYGIPQWYVDKWLTLRNIPKAMSDDTIRVNKS